MERNIKAYISIVLGILFCGSVLVGYMKNAEYVIELTCISNSCIGVLLLFTGINILGKKKKFSGTIYHMWLVAILLVSIISWVGHFNYYGAFFFLHFVNPLLFLVYYIVFIDDAKKYIKNLLTPMLVMGYLVFDYIIGKLRGKFIYGIFKVDEIDFADIVMVVFGVYISLLVIAVITQYINQKMKIIRTR